MATNKTFRPFNRRQALATAAGADVLGFHAVEEILTVLDGQAEMWIEDERANLTAGQSILVPAGRKHGFRNTGTGTLHVQATLAAPIFEASFDDQKEVSRRWVPGQ